MGRLKRYFSTQRRRRFRERLPSKLLPVDVLASDMEVL
jgi:hypothetical protein